MPHVPASANLGRYRAKLIKQIPVQHWRATGASNVSFSPSTAPFVVSGRSCTYCRRWFIRCSGPRDAATGSEHCQTQSRTAWRRRAVLQAFPAMLCTEAVMGPAASMPVAATPNATLSVPLQAFWRDCISAVTSGVGSSIDVNLIVWSPRASLPFGSPGDPAADYTTGGIFAPFNGGCGVRRKDAARPYAGCPAPGLPASNDLLAECCRHYAYCVPYTPRSTLALNSVTTVVLSERINDAPESVARGIIAHELGHGIDFHCFGSRYKLADHPPDGPWASSVAAIDAKETNFEIRADGFANLILGAVKAGQLCYAKDTRTQVAIGDDVACAGTASRRNPPEAPFAKHYLHDAPVSGILSL
eukprot:jgi/Ulvmu1/5623/UM023_0162.1